MPGGWTETKAPEKLRLREQMFNGQGGQLCQTKKRLVIKGLRNHDLGVLDSFAEARESSLRKPPCQKPASGSHLSEAIDSARIFRLTQLLPLTYPLIIEE